MRSEALDAPSQSNRRGIFLAPGSCSFVRGRGQFAAGDNSMYKDEGGKMNKRLVPAVLYLLLCAAVVIGGEKSVFYYTLDTIDGKPAPLSAYKGKVGKVVNVARRCGCTPPKTRRAGG